ncbi:DUF418 domain-containing protein [Aquibacillus halophilus]|uniref:DUF418 domain-containing protein n=1 Tax=Aquibacillus halophilus TaxID=930132 RepID=A0A6A8DER4_9BACI|nr:DUF418 domain-containing protein [Aquibacillus halophilus]MRH44188.1 DUF418 domain-containing protein [Aquibacillus halophilus]
MGQTGSPITESNRLQWIDAARGFAILGIFMVNTPAFNAPFFLYNGEDQFWNSSLDQAVQVMIDIFFQASFYTLFSFLFGFGMQIIINKLTDKQLNVRKLLFRRLIILIGFGLIHAFLIWHGDILLSYGIIGMLLLLFIRASNKALFYWAFGLLLFPTLIYSWLLYIVRDRLNMYNLEAINRAFENYGNGTIIAIWQQNYQDWMYSNGFLGFIFLTFALLPLFLLGMLVARKKWLDNVQQHAPMLKKVWILLLFVFIGVKAGPYLFGNPAWFSYTQDTIGGSASALFYLTSITLAFQKDFLAKLLKPFTYVGRMSLSNYLSQSIICFILFYSVGFGFYGQVSPIGSVAIVVVVYSIQVVVSKIWISNYRFGPMEWLWRRLMYGEKLPNKRKDKEVEQG